MKNKFFSSSAAVAVIVSRDLYGKVMIPSALQKAGAWWLQLPLYKRRGTGDYTGTISGIVAGLGSYLQLGFFFCFAVQ